MSTILHRLAHWAEEAPDSPAQRFKKDGKWKDISARELRDRVYYLALYLESRGMTRDDVSVILSPNCPEWVQLDLAGGLIGARSAGIYPNSTSKDIQYILGHTDAKILAVKDKDYFRKIIGEKSEYGLTDRVKVVLVFDGDTSVSPLAVSFEAAIKEGRKLATEKKSRKLGLLLADMDPNHGAFMIYTSGTTGNPKAALLTHDNLCFTADCVRDFWKLPQEGSLFSFLPLCHVAEKIQNIGVGISMRYLVTFCTKFENVALELPEVQPTLLLCVPRLWEKMMEGVMHKVSTGAAIQKRLGQWALGVGARVAEARYSGKLVNPKDLIQLKIADKLVLSKVRRALGLAHANTLASGAAALAPHISKWFRCIGLEILEDFGQTETTGVICMTMRGVECAGTVGKPVPGMEVKLAEDGEMLTRGRHVFKGYYKDDANTAAVFDQDGWLHTGDLAELDSRGLYRIRGRKKEILKTSGGKMVAPLPIEEELKADPIISQVCMVGDGRKFLAALITLSEATLAQLKKTSGALSGPTVQDTATLAEVQKAVDALNHHLSSYEQIKKFAVIPREFSIEDGEMTPTLKMKRNVIETRFRDLIDQMYS